MTHSAPVSYREDLKAVLRADKAQESARIKEEKRQAKLEARDAKKAQKSKKTKPDEASSDKGKDADDFELVETRVATSPSKPAAGKGGRGDASISPAASSSSKAQQPPKHIEPKPLSLAVKGTGAAATANPHPFFVKKAKQQPEAPIEIYDAPLPDFVCRMNRTRPQPALEGISLTGSDEFKSTDDFIGQIEMMHLSQLAVASTVDQAESCRKTGQLWNDAFRPHLSCGCLGNEGNASYLLDWLRRLLVAAPGSVRTTDSKRKHGIQRRVDRKRKKRRRGYSDDEDSDDMANFIVDDDEDDVGEYDDSIADDEVFGKFGRIDRQTVLTDDESVDLKSSQGTAPAGPASTAQPPASQSSKHAGFASLDKLTNCMVLTGPSGSGKTASVYASASELGYEVFELYPGMGRRSGRDLLAAVGDLGRNHMVSSGGVGGGATFKKPAAAAPSGSSTVRQSLILIEEADILFDEDKGFWAAVIELVAESKRPVVIVCNELDLVPVHDLPVQQILHYATPRMEEAVAWVQTVASEMGRFLPADEVEGLLLQLPGTEVAVDLEDEAQIDLRQALNQVQFGHFACDPPVSHADAQQRDFLETQAAKEMEMRAVARAAESSSLADVFETGLGRGVQADVFGDAGMETSATSRQWGSWVQLVAQPLAWHQQRQALAGSAEIEYRSTLADIHERLGLVGLPSIMTCDGVHEYGGVRMTDALLERLQHRERLNLRTLVRPLLIHRHSASHLPPSLITDYAPLIRLMALIDSDLAEIHASLQQAHAADPTNAPLPSGRSTRNSSRALTSWLTGSGGQEYGYERWLAALGPGEVLAAKKTTLVF
uniref:AAA+ ATPase domain-containing protein n=1 Tax=Kalmanozyma brasiliensis (strain GHG001) TaxID=1365824 RepID=V5EWS7_KALBG